MSTDSAPPNRLKEFRERIHLSQAQVAKLLDLTAAAVSRHEGRERRMDIVTAFKYASLYKVSAAELFVVFAKTPSKPVD